MVTLQKSSSVIVYSHQYTVYSNRMREFTNLKVWHRSIDFVTKVYEATAMFPKEEKYGLVSQINRAAISIPTNIAECAGRNTKKEMQRYLSISIPSLNELYSMFTVSKIPKAYRK